MLIETKKGRFKVDSNYRDAFRLEEFEEKYIEECFDKYLYIVGDLSSGILRLKGFDNNPNSKSYFGIIDSYLKLSCAMGCPYFVLKRIQSDKEYQEELSNPSKPKTDGFKINSLVKESFDKDSLILETSIKENPNIVIDPQKINAIPKGELTSDLKVLLDSDGSNSNSKNEVKQEASQSYVASSPGFVPNQNRNFNYRNNRKNKKK